MYEFSKLCIDVKKKNSEIINLEYSNFDRLLFFNL